MWECFAVRVPGRKPTPAAQRTLRLRFSRGRQPAYTYPDTTPSLDFLTGSIENSSITIGLNGGFAFDSNGYPNYERQPRPVADQFGGEHQTPAIAAKILVEPRVQRGFAAIQPDHRTVELGHESVLPDVRVRGLSGKFASTGNCWRMTVFVDSADPFDSFLTIPGTPTANNPNAVAYYPLTSVHAKHRHADAYKPVDEKRHAVVHGNHELAANLHLQPGDQRTVL